MIKNWMTVFAAALLGGGAVHAGVGVWTTAGPHGGSVTSVAISPQSPNSLYLALGRGGLFRSSNAGGTWTRAEAGLPGSVGLFSLATATSGSNVAFVLTGGARVMYRSADFGLSWFPLPSPWTPGSGAFSIAVGPGDGSRIAVLNGSVSYVSTNSGSSWTTSAAGSFASGPMTHVAIAANGDVYAAERNYNEATYGLNMVRKSTNGGASWSAAGALPDIDPTPVVQPLMAFISHLAVAPSDAQRLYLAGNALLTSANGGATWTEISRPSGCSLSRVQVFPSNPVGVWGVCGNTLVRSDDVTAVPPVWVSFTAAANNYTVNGTDPAQASSIALHGNYPTTAQVLVGTDSGGLLRTVNNGGLWLPRNNGFESTNIRGLGAHPRDANVLLAGLGDAFNTSVPMYRSQDSGLTWANSDAGLNAEQIRAIAIDPTTVDANPGTAENFHVYASGRAAAIPNATAIDGGVYKSTDSGNNWATIDNGIALLNFGSVTRPFMGTVRGIALDPRSCDSPPPTGACPAVVPPTAASTLKTVYIGGSGQIVSSGPDLCPNTVNSARIYKSTNAGASWTAADSGIPIGQDDDPGAGISCSFIAGVIPVIVDPNNPQVLYAGTFLGRDLGSPIEPTVNNGLFKSTNGGATWSHSSNGLPRVGGPSSSHWDVLAIAIAPSNSNRLYASTNNFLGPTPSGRVYRSDNAGASWTPADAGIAGADVRALLIDPNDASGNTVFAGAGGTAANPGGVYRSTDGGLTWNSYSIGLAADAALALAIPARGPGDPFRLFAGTVAGVWEFTEPPDPDGDGAPTPIEQQSPGPTTGDGNGDGAPDASQSRVASNAGVVFGVPASAGLIPEGAGSNVAFTIDIVSGGCTQINNSVLVQPALLPIDPRSELMSYPKGLVRFELPNCAQATIDVTFHGASFNDADWTWRNYGPTIPGVDASFGWYDLRPRVARLDADTWRLTLNAGQFGVYRATPNNILMVGGPAQLEDDVFANGFE